MQCRQGRCQLRCAHPHSVSLRWHLAGISSAALLFWKRNYSEMLQVLVAGSEVTLEYKIQVFTPPYLLNGNPRPAIETSPTNMTWHHPYDITWSGTDSIDRVVLQKMADSTHSISWDLRQVSPANADFAAWASSCLCAVAACSPRPLFQSYGQRTADVRTMMPCACIAFSPAGV